MSASRTRSHRHGVGIAGLGVTVACLAMLNTSCPASADDGVPPSKFPTYAFVDLGTLPGYDHSKAFAVNNAGEVVGLSTNDIDFGPNRAFIWRDGDMTDLGTLGGDGAAAVSVNDTSTVAGLGQVQPGLNAPTHAFLWEGAVMDDLGTLGGSTSWANHVTASGLVVGGSRLAGDSAFHPVLWVNGIPEDLGLLPEHWLGDARAMNTSGQIVGYSTSVFSEARAVLWEEEPQDLDTLPGGCCSEAFDINDAGQIVGFSWFDGTSGFHAVRWENKEAFDLGPLAEGHNSRALAINARADVVGVAWITIDGPVAPRATLWQDEAAFDLNCLIPAGIGWSITEARDINEAGQIVGFGINTETGVTHGLLLNPAIRSPGDFDGDGDVDLSDYAFLSDRLSTIGPTLDHNSFLGHLCAGAYDSDQDGDVDLRDFAAFQLAFTGAF